MPSPDLSIEKGLRFTNTEPLRVMPKVWPKGLSAVKKCLQASVCFDPGTTFEILNAAMVKERKRWYRVAAFDQEGKVLHRGFVIGTALEGRIERAA